MQTVYILSVFFFSIWGRNLNLNLRFSGCTPSLQIHLFNSNWELVLVFHRSSFFESPDKPNSISNNGKIIFVLFPNSLCESLFEFDYFYWKQSICFSVNTCCYWTILASANKTDQHRPGIHHTGWLIKLFTWFHQ